MIPYKTSRTLQFVSDCYSYFETVWMLDNLNNILNIFTKTAARVMFNLPPCASLSSSLSPKSNFVCLILQLQAWSNFINTPIKWLWYNKPASAWGIKINVHLISLHLSLLIITYMVGGAVFLRMTSQPPHTSSSRRAFDGNLCHIISGC